MLKIDLHNIHTKHIQTESKDEFSVFHLGLICRRFYLQNDIIAK
jgi:hypothetical protein